MFPFCQINRLAKDAKDTAYSYSRPLENFSQWMIPAIDEILI